MINDDPTPPEGEGRLALVYAVIFTLCFGVSGVASLLTGGDRGITVTLLLAAGATVVGTLLLWLGDRRNRP